uniref:Uncharacterized protein n=1 Tax=Arundo donax TaxID=35708 RepID=A0A0A9CDC9_ARUDO
MGDMISDTACLGRTYSIQGHNFVSDFRLLEVQGYDMVLGADWIYIHSPIGLNLQTRQFSVTKYGGLVITFIDETLPDRNCMVGTKKLCKMLKKGSVGAVVVLNNSGDQDAQTENNVPDALKPLIQQYNDIFTEPSEVPPSRQIDHSIPLLPEAKVVNKRPYILPHHQNDAMEELIAQMLKSEIIRPSVSPYSSPVILVKKKDGT